MINELTNIENQVHPDMLKAAFARYVPDFSLNYLGNPGNPGAKENIVLEISPGYFIILEKFKRLFFNELCRIRYAMQDGKIHKTEDVFSNYISVNYSCVIQIGRAHV